VEGQEGILLAPTTQVSIAGKWALISPALMTEAVGIISYKMLLNYSKNINYVKSLLEFTLYELKSESYSINSSSRLGFFILRI